MKQLSITIVFLFAALSIYAQSANDVTLIVSGQGNTREEATANALRSAIEQSYGVFVSANTQILNDEIVKDEIATVASGNVKEYKELSCMTMPDGLQSVTLSATVSISNLISYAKSHGSSAEFAGQTFMMNVKMRQLNTENELKALIHLKNQVAMMARNIYDYSIEVIGEPKLLDNGNYEVQTLVTAKSNWNYTRLINIITSTLQSLSLPQSEVEAWHRNNMKTSTVDWKYKTGIPATIDLDEIQYNTFYLKCIKQKYFFRNDQLTLNLVLLDIIRYLTTASLSWSINIDGTDVCYSIDASTVRDRSAGYGYGYTGTLISNKKGSSNNDDSFWIGTLDRFMEVPIPTSTACISVFFHLSEEELFSTTGFDVKSDYQLYNIYSKRSITDIHLNLPNRHPSPSEMARIVAKDNEKQLEWLNKRMTSIMHMKIKPTADYYKDGQWVFNDQKNVISMPIEQCFVYTFRLNLNLTGLLVFYPYSSPFYGDITYLFSTQENESHVYLDQTFYELMNKKIENKKIESSSSTDFSLSRDEIVNNYKIEPSYEFIDEQDPPQMPEKTTVDDKIVPSQAYENPGTNDKTAASQTVPFQLVQEKPSFMGGDANAFSKWVNQRLVYPAEAKAKGIQGRVALEFTIDINGAVKDVKVLKGIEASLDAEAVRVVSMSHEWTPGKNDGQSVAVTYRFPVIFQIK